jgi:hypothetical protein
MGEQATQMTLPVRLMVTAALVTATPLLAQTSNDPFPSPISATEGVIRVDFVEFASIPDIDGEPARMMGLVDELGTDRIFVNDMRGPIYTVSYDGRTVTQYVDIDDPQWDPRWCPGGGTNKTRHIEGPARRGARGTHRSGARG